VTGEAQRISEQDRQIEKVIAEDGCYCEEHEPFCTNHLIESALTTDVASSRSAPTGQEER
jgi:hypothetical protein